MDEVVQIVPYNPQWQDWFAKEATYLGTLFNQSRLVAIEHYGSTAVPGLAAKPSIGILVGLSALPLTSTETQKLTQSGYQFDKQLEGRTYWRKYAPHNITLAVTLFGSETWFDHLAVRDYLRLYPEIAHAYAAIKYQAIENGKITSASYRHFKKPFLDELFLCAKKWQCSSIKK